MADIFLLSFTKYLKGMIHCVGDMIFIVRMKFDYFLNVIKLKLFSMDIFL